jgi:arylsulfatase A-like enzyme
MPVHSYDSTGTFPKARQRVEKTFSTELFADATVRFLDTKPGQPFSLYVAFTAPHDPRTPPASYARLYKPEKIPLPGSFLPQHPFDNGELKVRDEQLLPWPRTTEAVQREIASYYAMISHLDAQIGRILDSLRKHDLDENTFVIFAGDNGLAVGRHGLLGKQNLYDHSVRVPLILCGPGIPRNKRSDALVYLFDLFPTICELAGVPLPATVEGKSLVGIMTGREPKVRDSVFGAYRQVQRMVRNDRWKLIQYPRLGREQLFDLKADPDELHDLARDAEQAPMVEKLRAELARWQKQTGDPLARNPGPSRPAVPIPSSP